MLYIWTSLGADWLIQKYFLWNRLCFERTIWLSSDVGVPCTWPRTRRETSAIGGHIRHVRCTRKLRVLITRYRSRWEGTKFHGKNEEWKRNPERENSVVDGDTPKIRHKICRRSHRRHAFIQIEIYLRIIVVCVL